MLLETSSAHIATSRNIKGFRSCKHATAIGAQDRDRRRVLSEERGRTARERRRLWLSEQWNGRFRCAAERLRALPPGAAPRKA